MTLQLSTLNFIPSSRYSFQQLIHSYNSYHTQNSTQYQYVSANPTVHQDGRLFSTQELISYRLLSRTDRSNWGRSLFSSMLTESLFFFPGWLLSWSYGVQCPWSMSRYLLGWISRSLMIEVLRWERIYLLSRSWNLDAISSICSVMDTAQRDSNSIIINGHDHHQCYYEFSNTIWYARC